MHIRKEGVATSVGVGVGVWLVVVDFDLDLDGLKISETTCRIYIRALF